MPTSKVCCRNLRKVIKYLYLLPSLLQSVLCLHYNLFSSRSLLTTAYLKLIYLNLVLFCFSWYSHQLSLSFIAGGTSKDSNLGCLHFFCYAFSFRKRVLFIALAITSVLMMSTSLYTPSSLHLWS